MKTRTVVGKYGFFPKSGRKKQFCNCNAQEAIVVAPVASATVINPLDLVYIDTGFLKPASALPDTGTLSGNQMAFHDVFLGVALDGSKNGETVPLRVQVCGRIPFACASATWIIGDMVGLAASAGHWPLSNTNVVKVAATANAIGRVVNYGAGLVLVNVDIVSTVQFGGPMPV